MKYFTPTKLSENISETPEGFLVCIGVSIARTGEMIYGAGETPLEADSKGKVIITRSEQEVFRPETLASFEGKPVTILHPREFVAPENWSQLAKGIVNNVRRGEGEQKDDLIADLLITDKEAIDLVKNGLREVSCGYEAEYEQTEEGRGNQSNIIGNHLALVEQGRAGSSYAINDHKGDSTMGKLEKILKKLFGKTRDEATKDQLLAAATVMDAEGGPDITEKNVEYEALGKGYDELVKSVKDLGSKFEAMKKGGKDAKGEAEAGQGEKDMPPAKAGGKDDGGDMEARLAKLEMICSKLMEKMGASDDAAGENEEEVVGDADEEEMEDDDYEESGMTGDTASRAEILAPGIKKSKDMKVKALKTVYGTKDGKTIVDAFTGGKAPKYSSKAEVNRLFVGVSEVLKSQRTADLKRTKTSDAYEDVISKKGPMTAEQMNEANAKHYNKK